MRKTIANKYCSISSESTPSNFNWILRGAITPVKNRGVLDVHSVFAYICSLEAIWFIKNGILLGLSEQQIIDCTPFLKGKHKLNKALLSFNINNPDVETESEYPYTATISNSCRFNISNNHINTTGITRISHNITNNLLEYLITNQPIIASIELRNGYLKYTAGIYKGTGHIINPNYTVVIIGYGISDNIKYWIVKESMGTTFGMNGYIHIAYNTCNIGEKGIWYPNID